MKQGSFLKGAVFGALAGAAAGLLFAPKSGRETRDDIKRKTDQLKKQAISLYDDAKASLNRKMEEVKGLGEEIDRSKYLALVTQVVDEVKKEKEVGEAAAKQLGEQLRKDWDKVKAAIKA